MTYQIAGNQEMNTSYDKVTEFTFGIDVTKQLNGKKETLQKTTEMRFSLFSIPEKLMQKHIISLRKYRKAAAFIR